MGKTPENTKSEKEEELQTKKPEVQPTKSMECPVVQKASADDKDLPYDKRLELLENEAESLYEFCLTKGYSGSQLKECLSPFVDKHTSLFQRIIAGSVRSFFALAILVVALSAMLKMDTTRDLLTIHFKLLNYKTLYIYDWRHLFEQQDCLVHNHFLEDKKLEKSDCYGCIDYAIEGGMDRLKNVSNAVQITDNYLYIDWPFIVTDATRDWPRDKNGNYTFTMENIRKLYETHGAVKNQKDCSFMSTPPQYTTALQVLSDHKEGALPDNFHVIWQNCEPKAGKVFRRFIQRPYFLPSMVELQPVNSIIYMKESFADTWFSLHAEESAVWLVVLEGELRINIRPVDDCVKYGCKEFEYTLGVGEAVVVPTRVFMLEYTSNANGSTLAFSSSAIWDELKASAEE